MAQKRTQKQYADDLLKNYVSGVPKSKVRKPRRKKTVEQKARMDANKALRKENFGEYLSNKVLREMASRERAREKKKANKALLEKEPNLFNNYDEFLQVYPTNEICLKAFAGTRLNADGKLSCPHCRMDTTVYTCKGNTDFLCKACNRPYSITVGTPFHNCKIPMLNIFKLMYFETEFKHGLTVEKAADIIGISVKSAYELLNKLRKYGFIQSSYIPPNSVVIIDTMASGGNNINRQDHNKLTHEESLARQKQVLVIKTKDGKFSIAISIAGRTAKEITAIIKSIVGIHAIIHTDEGTEFAGLSKVFYFKAATDKNGEPVPVKFDDLKKFAGTKIPVIVYDERMEENNGVPVLVFNYYTHLTANHSAGDHGEGAAESLNSILKQGIMYHCNCFTKENFQLFLNFLAFHAQHSHLTACQRFLIVLNNLGKLQDIKNEPKKPIRRRSIWLQLQREKFAAKKTGQPILN